MKLFFVSFKVRSFQEGERRSCSYTPTTPRSGALEALNVMGLAEKMADLDTGCDLLVQITNTAWRCAD